MKYINIGNEVFTSYLQSEYIDKTGMIAVINKTIGTERRYTCVTRCRRFGKSMAANMLTAYYDKSCDSSTLFANTQIAKDPSFEQYLNKYPVIKLDITDFTTKYRNDETIVCKIQEELKAELQEVYPGIASTPSESDLMDLLIAIADSTGERFIMIIDEWDAICREFEPESKVMDAYVDWLRRMFKGSNSLRVFAGAYLTGILPIKKYKTESALNNFREYSMVQPQKLAEFFGFTASEVQMLCEKHGMDYDEMAKWYDGYKIGNEPSIFNPYSVMEAIASGECDSYFAKTGTYASIADYIQMDYNGLKDDVIKMLGGGRCLVDTTKFQNDLSIINCKDDVLTVLIHLGYLAYDKSQKQCYIPNMEVAGELTNAVEDSGWNGIIHAVKASNDLLAATLAGDEEAVAKGIDAAHDENTSILSYNDENSLACVLRIAYYSAINDYILHSELGMGKGFADLVMIPRKHVNKPAVILELKYSNSVDADIAQIHNKQYPAKISEYMDSSNSIHAGEIVLVGINYDKKTKQHECKIERIVK